jgi:hypothetical protein
MVGLRSRRRAAETDVRGHALNVATGAEVKSRWSALANGPGTEADGRGRLGNPARRSDKATQRPQQKRRFKNSCNAEQRE